MLTFRKLKDTIVGQVDGKPFNVSRTKDTETTITNMAANEEVTSDDVFAYIASTRGTVIAESNPYLHFKPDTKEYFLCLDNKRSKIAIIPALVAYIEESFDKGIDFLPVLKAWARLLSNPRYNTAMGNYFNAYLSSTFTDMEEVERLVDEEEYTHEAAEALATYQDIAITQEGLLATFKVAKEVTWIWVLEEDKDGNKKKVKKDRYAMGDDKIDPVTGKVIEEGKREQPEFKENFIFTPAIYTGGDDFYSGDVLGYIYEVGKVQSLPKKAKRNLSNTFGGGGLYIGGLNYIDNYRNCGSHVLTCLVNPCDILSFQSEGSAIRVDALMPNNIMDSDVKLEGKYHSSDYDKLSTERLENIIAEDIKLKNEAIAKEEAKAAKATAPKFEEI